MYAIIKTGGKQYRVQENDVLKVEKLNAAVGETVTFDEVVAVGRDKLQVGTPFVEGCAVQAEVLEQGKITGIGAAAKKAAPAKAKTTEKAEKSEVKASRSRKKEELLEIAKNLGVEVPSKATKADILSAIESK